jgi:hypothetical protein
MNKSPLYRLFFFLCVFISSISHAQNIDTLPSVIIQDTIYQNTIASAENYEFKEPSKNKVDTRTISPTEVKKLKSGDEYWYVDQAPFGNRQSLPPGVNQKGEKERQEPMERSREFNFPVWIRVLFWIVLIGAFVAMLIWFLATSDIRLFRKKSDAVEEKVEDPSTEDIFEMNFEKELQKAVEAKNYRLAVRLLYLRTLRDLSNRNLINYTHEKTNSDYLFQLAGTPYYKNFFKLTRSFDYTWYGHFELSQDAFGLIQNDFSSFKQQLS